MRKGAAGHGACDPKFRIGVGSSFADVAYRRTLSVPPDGVFRFVVVAVIIHQVFHNVNDDSVDCENF